MEDGLICWGIAFGMMIESNFPLNHLPPATIDGPSIELEVHRSSLIPSCSGAFLASYQAAGRTMTWTVLSEDRLVIRLDDSFCFELHLQANRICCFARAEVPDQLLHYWILQQILPIFLILNGSLDFLHCTGVSIHTLHDGDVAPTSGCIGFHGPSHAGKSTILSHFLSKGHFLVADDHLAISNILNGIEAIPSTPFYRPYRAIEDLGIPAMHYSPDRRPLKRIYLLKPVAADADVFMENVSQSEAVWTFLRDRQYLTSEEGIPRGLALAAKRLKSLCSLASKVPIVRLHVPRSLERLVEVYDLVRDHLEV